MVQGPRREETMWGWGNRAGVFKALPSCPLYCMLVPLALKYRLTQL